MNCTACGAQLREQIKFCTKCGAPVESVAARTPAMVPLPPQQPPSPGMIQGGPPQDRFDDMRPALVPIAHKYVSDKKLVIKNPEKLTYVEMSAEDVVFLHYLNGQYSVTDIVKEVYEQTGRMSFKRLYNLLLELYANDFLEPAGIHALSELAKGANISPAENVFSKITHAFERFQIPLAALAAPIKGMRFLVAPFLKMPVLAVIFLLCVVPVIIASLLASEQAAFLGAAGKSLSHAMSYFSPPDQKGYNIFMFKNSYLLGLAFSYVSAFAVLSFRSLVRGAALTALGCEVYRPALRSYYVIFFIDIDGRDIVMADRNGRMVFFSIGIVSTLVIGTIINIIQHILGFSHLLYMIYIIAYMITFLNLCIFFQTDLFHLIDNYFEIPHLGKHVRAYITQKFFQQILSFRSTFTQEKSLTTIACIGIVWLYVAVSVFFTFMKENLVLLMNNFGAAGALDKFAILIFLINILGPFVLLTISLLFLVLRNVARLVGAPLGRVLRRMSMARGRSPADPAQIAGFIARIPLFMNLSGEEQYRIAGLCRQASFKTGHNVIVQGDPGHSFYVILEGSVDVILEDPSGMKTTIDTLRAGDSFGEIALIENTARTATIRAAEPLTVLELARPYFDEFVSQSQDAKDRITEVIRMTAALRKIPFFQELAPSKIPDIISRLKKQGVKKGDVVIWEGAPGDKFYIISDGAFKVMKGAPDGTQKAIAALGKNESFGEIALLNSVPRTSSVIAETDGLLYALDRDEFLSVARTNIQAGLILENETERKLAALSQKAG